jgi:hypothetical protein
MGAAKWIRFAVLVSFSGMFFWLCYVRSALWILPALIFAEFAALILRRS